jgi:hypothetical protein
MKNITYRSVIIALVGTILMCLSFAGTGCASMSQTQSQRLSTAATIAAYVGTTEVLRRHPEYRTGFELAAGELKALEEGNVDALKLMQIVNRLPVKELKGDRASMIITTATILLTDEIGTTPIEKLNDLKPIVKAIRTGIERGLQ